MKILYSTTRMISPQFHRLLAMILLALPLAGHAQFTTTTNNGAITITGYTGTDGVVTIPATLNGLPVTSIGTNAFDGNTNLTSVIFSEGLTDIGDSAFSYTALTNIVIPDSVVRIGDYAFTFDSGLTSVTLGANLASIGDYAFISTALSSIVIPNNVTNIGAQAFSSLSSLTNLTLGNSVSYIGDFAFAFAGLTNVTIPASVARLGSSAFDYNFNLTDAYFLGNAPDNDDTAFQSDSSATAYYLNGTTGWTNMFGGIPTATVVPPGGAVQVTLNPSEAVTAGAQWSVDGGALQSSGAVVANLSAGNHTLSFSSAPGWVAPADQSVAISVDATNSVNVTYAVGGPFTWITNNGTITITSFVGTSNTLTIPDTINGLPVTVIGVSAFAFNTNLVSVIIPDSVTDISDYAFANNPALTSVTFSTNLASLGNYSFFTTALTNIVIPNHVVIIGDDAFASTPALANVTLGTNVTSIGDNAFFFSSLTNVTIPASITSLGSSAFAYSGNLTSAYFLGNAPANDGTAFQNAPTTVYYKYGTTGWTTTFGGATTATIIPRGSLQVFIAPAGAVTAGALWSLDGGAYTNASGAIATGLTATNNNHAIRFSTVSGWTTPANQSVMITNNATTTATGTYVLQTGSLSVSINPVAAVTAGGKWAVDGGVLQASGATVANLTVGNHTVSYNTISGWTAPANQSVSVSLNTTAMTSGTYLVPNPFRWITNNGTITITGFSGTSNTLTIPATITGLPVTSIGTNAFAGLAMLTNVVVPNSVTNLGDYAFYQDSTLINVTLGTNVVSIGAYAFSQTALTGIAFPNSLTNLGDYAFNFTYITNVILPNSLTRIGESVFSDTMLASVTFGTNVTSIGDNAFSYSKLTSVTLPRSLTNVDTNAFASCPGLTAAYFLGNAPADNGTAFERDSSAKVYYYIGTTGWGSTFGGVATVPLNPTGSLQVSINPPGAITAGAKWSVDSGALQNSGATVTSLTLGNHTISYSTVSGWQTPTNQSVYINFNSILITNGNYPQILFTWVTNNGTITITGYSGTNNSVVIPATITGLPVTRIGTNAFANIGTLHSVLIPASVTSISSNAFYRTGLNVNGNYDPYNNGRHDRYYSGAANQGSTYLTVAFSGNAPIINGSIFTSAIRMAQNGYDYDQYGYNYVNVTYLAGTTGWNTANIANASVQVASTSFGVGFSYYLSATNYAVTAIAITNGFNFILTNDVVVITGGSGFRPFYQTWSFPFLAYITGTNYITNAASCNIPATLDCLSPFGNFPVTSIGDWAFFNSSLLSSVNFTNTIQRIGAFAFASDNILTNVTIPTNVISIGSGAFASCSALTNFTVTAGNLNYSSINGVLFNVNQSVLVQYPGGLSGSYTIPSTVTTLSSNSFQGSTLSSVVIPNGVTNIQNGAFFSCAALTSVTIPASVTSIGRDAFAGCTALTNITVAAGNPKYSSTNGSLFNANQTILIQAPAGLHGFYYMPNSVTKVADDAYYNCRYLFYINNSTNLTVIGDPVFYGCTNLTAYTIPATVTNLDPNAFQGCINLTNIDVEPGNPFFSSINGVLFSADGTTLIEVPGGATSVTIPNSATQLGDGAFIDCPKLTTVTIPASVTSIGANVFQGCTNLTSILVAMGNPNYQSINGVLFSADGTTLIQYPPGLSGNYTIPSTVTSIAAGAFASSQLSELTVPASVINVGAEAFANSPGLATVYFQGNAPTNDGTAFNGDNNVVTTYYYFGTTGWDAGSFGGVTTTQWNIALIAPGFTNPSANATVPNTAHTIQGTLATNNINVSAVYYSLNNAGLVLATTTNNWSNWSGSATFVPGTNTLLAFALDGNGNISSTNIIQFVVNPFNVLHSFFDTNAPGPMSDLVLSGNTLYGTTYFGGVSNLGTVFAINTDGSGFTNLYSFSGSDGANPHAGLILSGNTLYGTTVEGGVNDLGTVFAIKTDGTGFTNLYSFSGSDGAYPEAGLILSGRTLYGATPAGGVNNRGTVFAINTDGTGFTNLYSFSGSDGANPNAGLILSGHTLYSTTFSGGVSDLGTVFAINTDGTGFTSLYSFSGSSGNPDAGLILSDHTLYGTTDFGGENDQGMVFAINTDGTGFTNLHSFSGSDGTLLEAGLILSGHTLYSMTRHGGVNNQGTVFAINTDGTGFATLYNFSDSDGVHPDAGLILSDHRLYGMTQEGGVNGEGTIFSLLLPETIIANNSTYNRNGLNLWLLKISDLFSNVTDLFGNPVSLAGVSGSTNGIPLVIRSGYIQYYNTNLVDDQFTYTVTNTLGLYATGVITLTAAPAQPLSGQIASLAMTNGVATLHFGGIANYTYQVQVSTNLTDWRTLEITNAPASGVFQFTDPNPPQPSAFYRLLWSGNLVPN